MLFSTLLAYTIYFILASINYIFNKLNSYLIT
nr:MAG TPA: hypothetical protein [Caudoviricetes sp.]